MDKLLIEKTKYTPYIEFDGVSHTLKISGESYPENISEFYTQIFDWLEAYLERLPETQAVTVNIEMIYFNSNSSKMLTRFFDTLDRSAAEGKKIAVNWYYDKENDMSLEHGEEFKEDAELLTFNLIQIQNGD
jgi:hypothetical protein